MLYPDIIWVFAIPRLSHCLEGQVTMSEKKWKHRAPQKSFSRDQRKGQVLLQFGVWNRNGDTEPKTMNRIAKALGMSPSSAVTEMLLELVDEGKLAFVEREKSGRWTARAYYSTVKSIITEKYGKRRINVKSRGQVVGTLKGQSGQLELWS